MGEVSASHLCMYSALAEVVAGAFGGKKDSKGPITENLSEASPEQFQARVSQLLSL